MSASKTLARASIDLYDDWRLARLLNSLPETIAVVERFEQYLDGWDGPLERQAALQELAALTAKLEGS